MSEATMSVLAPFRWEGPLLAVDLPGARACFTTRAGGVSTGPFASLDLARYAEREADVSRNMQIVAGLIGVPLARWAQSRQVHGTGVRSVTDEHALGDDGTEADGQVLNVAGAAAVVLTADCLPVVVAAGRAVAVLHAGWRGLAGGVLERGVQILAALVPGAVLHAAIGPAAGGCCYEVGGDVRAAFADDGVLALRAGTASPIDLKAIAARRLHAAGVSSVHDCGLCTMCATGENGERRFFSHRADGGRTGRQAALAWLS